MVIRARGTPQHGALSFLGTQGPKPKQASCDSWRVLSSPVGEFPQMSEQSLEFPFWLGGRREAGGGGSGCAEGAPAVGARLMPRGNKEGSHATLSCILGLEAIRCGRKVPSYAKLPREPRVRFSGNVQALEKPDKDICLGCIEVWAPARAPGKHHVEAKGGKEERASGGIQGGG